MVINKEPETFEKIRPLYELVTYCNGKGIAISQTGDLFYFTCDEGVIDIGCCIEEDLLHPLSELESEERIEIMKWFVGKILEDDDM